MNTTTITLLATATTETLPLSTPAMARATGWRPTHRIVTRKNGVGAPETVDVCLHDGVAYTAHEWASQSDADWEVSDEGEWLYRGQEYPGAYEVTEI